VTKGMRKIAKLHRTFSSQQMTQKTYANELLLKLS